ncbi:hypothetical protein D3C81_1602120 [compost metagenome]
MCRIVIITAVYATRTNNFDWHFTLHFFHRSYLNRGSLSTHQKILSQIEGVLHIASRMILRQIKCFEVVIILLYFRTLCDPVTHSNENILNILNDLI